MSDRLTWGLQPPEGTTLAWGARAIYKGGAIDLLPDRQAWRGPIDERKPLVDWLNTTGRAAIERAAKHANLRGDEERTVRHESAGFTIEASPRGSHGYLYLVAYPTPCPLGCADHDDGCTFEEAEATSPRAGFVAPAAIAASGSLRAEDNLPPKGGA